MLFRIITWLFVIVMVYRLISRYILPVFKISSTVNDRLRDMQNQMQDMQQKANRPNENRKVKKDGDYIDYEEIR